MERRVVPDLGPAPEIVVAAVVAVPALRTVPEAGSETRVVARLKSLKHSKLLFLQALARPSEPVTSLVAGAATKASES